MHILIDGYNFIRQVSELSQHEMQSLEAGRDALINLLAQYKKIKRHKITVIFDGVLNLSEFSPAYQEKGIHIRFSPENKSADDVICEMVKKERDRAIVVSSDNSILNFATENGSAIILSPDFYEKVQMTRLLGTLDDRETFSKKEGFVHKRWQTKKKGPAKRLPKRERKNQVKKGKL